MTIGQRIDPNPKTVELIREKLKEIEAEGCYYNGSDPENEPATYWMDKQDDGSHIVYYHRTKNLDLGVEDLDDYDIDGIRAYRMDEHKCHREIPEKQSYIDRGESRYYYPHDGIMKIKHDTGNEQNMACDDESVFWEIVTGADPVKDGWEDGCGTPIGPCENEDDE